MLAVSSEVQTSRDKMLGIKNDPPPYCNTALSQPHHFLPPFGVAPIAAGDGSRAYFGPDPAPGLLASIPALGREPGRRGSTAGPDAGGVAGDFSVSTARVR